MHKRKDLFLMQKNLNDMQLLKLNKEFRKHIYMLGITSNSIAIKLIYKSFIYYNN